MPYRTRLSILCLAAAALLAVVPAVAHAQVNFTAELFGQAEVPPVDTDDYGSCVGVLSEDETLFTLSCEHTLDDAVAAHIHTGFSDEAGPVLFGLGNASSPIQAEWNLDGDDVVRLLATGLYVNVHTPDHPNGEIRGQLLPSLPIDTDALSFPLSRNQVVPPVAGDTSGACYTEVLVEPVPFTPIPDVTLTLRCAHDVEDATAAELVIGAEGENGTTTFPIADGDSPFEVVVELDNEAVVAYINNELYLQILSASHPDGELRGQVQGCIGDQTTLCLQDNRFQVTMSWDTGTASDNAVGKRITTDSGTYWFFRPSNIEALVKVLDGCGVNDHYWVFLAATTNVGFELRVLDTFTGEDRSYGNNNGTFAQPRLDTAAFETCP